MPNKLKKILRLQDLVAYGVGGTIGAGIFVSIGVGAVQAGPALFLSFLIAAIACSISGLCFCEMASRVPTSGSSYSYAYKVLGDFPAFVIGSVLVLDSIISAAACARAWTAYVRIICPFLPHFLVGDLRIPGLEHILSISILSCLVCLGIGTVLALGIRETTTFNNFTTILNVIVLAVFIVAGLPLSETANWTPFAPNGVGGIVRGSGRIFFAYLGFDVVNCLAEETGDSKGGKTLVPRAILMTIIITTFIYVLVSVAFVGLAPVKSINLSSPLSSALEFRHQAFLAYLVGLGAVGNTLTSVLSNFLVQPRIMLRMASDGFLPKSLSEIDDNGVPRLALFVTVFLSAVTALFVDFETLADLVSVASLVSLSVVCICSILVRVKPLTWIDEVPMVEPPMQRSNTPPPPIIESEIDDLITYPNLEKDMSRFEVSLVLYVSLGLITSATLLHTTPLWLKLSLAISLAFLLAAICSQYMILPKDVEISSVSQGGIFRVPFSPFLPLLGVFINTYLLVGLPTLALIRAAAVFACCGAYYCLVLRPSSKDNHQTFKKHHQQPCYDSVS